MAIFKNKVLILIIITLLSNVLGLLREIILTKNYGTTATNDNIILAQIVPIMILGFTLFTFSSSYISFYNKNKNHYSSSNINTSSAMIVVLTVLIVLLGYYPFIDDIYKLLFNVTPDHNLIVLTELFLLVTIFLALTTIPMAYLQINNKFYVANISNMIIVNLIVIIFLLIYKSVYSFPVGYGIGTFISFIIITAYSFKCGFIVNPIEKYNKHLSLEFLSLSSAIMTVNIVNQIFNVIDRLIASQLDTGIVTAIYLSNRLVNITIMIVVTPLLTVFFPKLSKYHFENNNPKFYDTVKNIISLIMITTLPLSIFIFINANSVIYVLFERGTFTNKDTILTANILKVYSLSIVLWCLREILSKIFISQYKYKAILFNTIILAFLNIIFGLIFINIFGELGIPLSSGIALLLTNFILLYLMYYKDSNNINFTFLKNPTELWKFIVLCVLTIFIFIFVQTFFNSVMSLFVNGFVLLILYFIFFKINIFSIQTLFRRL